MAQAGFTPISLYYSTTAAAVPSSGNLVAGELALNTVDEKLYFKNSAGTVKLLASNATSAPVVSFSAGTTGFTPSTATTGAITLAGTLAVANGGTGVTSSTGTGSVVLSTSPTLVTPALGTPSSGTVTNLTGTASININGTVGATTANTGAFTTLTATGQFNSTSGGSAILLNGATANYITWGATGIGLPTFGTRSVGTKLVLYPSLGGSSVDYGFGINAGTLWCSTPSTTELFDWYGGTSRVASLSSSGDTFATLSTTQNAVVTAQNSTGAYLQLQSNVQDGYLNMTGNGSIYIRNGSSLNTRFVFGSAGQFGIGATPSYGNAGEVLTSGGSGAAPTWAAAGGGSQAFVAFGSTGGY